MSTAMKEPPTRAHMVIGGQPVTAPTRPVVNPANFEEVVGEAPDGDRQHAEAAIEAAQAAWKPWRQRTAFERATLMLEAADRIEAEIQECAVLLTREHGKVLPESIADMRGAVGNLRYYASLAERYEQEVPLDSELGKVVLTRQSMGPTAVIVPWNYPPLLGFLMLSPALLAGNTAIVKLPDHAPFALTRALGHLLDVLPAGVVNVVGGSGEKVGASLTRDPRVRKVMFTGSSATGKQVIRDAAETMKSVSIEAGGNDPAIVLESAIIDDRLIRELVKGAFTSSGQICYAPKRMYVHESHYAAFMDSFTEAAAQIVVGNGLDPEVTMGPLNNERQYEFVQRLIRNCEEGGATVRTVGKKRDSRSWDNGWFLLPSIVTNVRPDAELIECEQFGPITPIMSFTDENEAVELANNTEYGLAASVWSQDVEHAFSVARRVEAGSVFINVHRVGASHVSMPFGGFKQSGTGRGHGFEAVEECSELQTLAYRPTI